MLNRKNRRTERKNVRKKPFPDVAGYFWLITSDNEEIVQVIGDDEGFPTEFLDFTGTKHSVFDREGAEWLNVMKPEDLILKPRKQQYEDAEENTGSGRYQDRHNSKDNLRASVSYREDAIRQEEEYQSMGNVALG